MADMQRASSQQGMAESLMRPEYAQNSGALGSLAMMAQAFAGNKLAKRASADDASARERYYKGEAAMKDAEARREAERKIAAEQAERAQREADAEEFGLTGRDRIRYIAEGKVGEGVRGVPMMTDQGLVNVNPYTNEYESVRPQGQGVPAGVRIDPNLPPEIQAAIAEHERNGTGIPDELNVTQQRPLMPYRAPEKPTEESFGQPQPVTGPDGRVQMVQFGNRGGRREVTDYAPPPTARDAKPPTEGERNAAGYYSRMESAGRELDALTNAGYDPGNARDYYTAGQGPMLNWAASNQGQQYRQQQEDWVRAKLRKESGAVIGDEEMAREIKTYFPQPGDKPEVIKAKARSRSIAEDAMRKSGGRAIDVGSGASDDDLIRKYLK